MISPFYENKSRLINDPELPQLTTVLDEQIMVGRFSEYLCGTKPWSSLEVTQCAIEKIYYRPTKHCRLLYRVTLRDSYGNETDEWFFGSLCRQDRGQRQFERAVFQLKQLSSNTDADNGKQAVHHLKDPNMVLWTFPYDPKMRTLSDVVDRSFVQQRVEANIDSFLNGNSEDQRTGKWRCQDIEYARVKYMPQKRCILRFHMNLVSPSGDTREVTFYSKTYNDAMSSYHFKMIKLAYDQLAAQNSPVNIPKPILHLEGYNTFWQQEWKGKSLFDVFDECNWEELFPRIAEMLAALHSSKINNLRRGPDPRDVLTTANEDAALLTQMLPEHEKRICSILEALHFAKGAVEEQEPPAVPIHGAFRIAQILIRDTEMALVDFDALALGDPLLDIAEFIASLQYLEVEQGRPRESLTKAANLFYSSYLAEVPWSGDHRRLAWYVLAFLLSKMLLSFKNLNLEALENINQSGFDICADWVEKLSA